MSFIFPPQERRRERQRETEKKILNQQTIIAEKSNKRTNQPKRNNKTTDQQTTNLNTEPFFFPLRLPIGQYGPVSLLSCPEKREEAVQVHLIGAEPIVQVRTWNSWTGPFLQSLLKNKHKQNRNKEGHSPPRQPGTPRPGSQVHGPRINNQRELKRLQRQIQVRLNVHRHVLNDALSSKVRWPIRKESTRVHAWQRSLQLFTWPSQDELKKQEPKWNSLHSLPQQSVWPLRSLTKYHSKDHHSKCSCGRMEVGPEAIAPGFAGAFPI